MGLSASKGVITSKHAHALLGPTEAQRLEEGFVRLCGRGRLLRRQFFVQDLLLTAFPNMSVQLGNRIFHAIDTGEAQEIELDQFLCSVAVLTRGTLEQQMQIFGRLFDLDASGVLNRDIMCRFLRVIYGRPFADGPRCAALLARLFGEHNDGDADGEGGARWDTSGGGQRELSLAHFGELLGVQTAATRHRAASRVEIAQQAEARALLLDWLRAPASAAVAGERTSTVGATRGILTRALASARVLNPALLILEQRYDPATARAALAAEPAMPFNAMLLASLQTQFLALADLDARSDGSTVDCNDADDDDDDADDDDVFDNTGDSGDVANNSEVMYSDTDDNGGVPPSSPMHGEGVAIRGRGGYHNVRLQMRALSSIFVLPTFEPEPVDEIGASVLCIARRRSMAALYERCDDIKLLRHILCNPAPPLIAVDEDQSHGSTMPCDNGVTKEEIKVQSRGVSFQSLIRWLAVTCRFALDEQSARHAQRVTNRSAMDRAFEADEGENGMARLAPNVSVCADFVFRSFDRDNDGMLALPEWRAMHECFGLAVPPPPSSSASAGSSSEQLAQTSFRRYLSRGRGGAALLAPLRRFGAAASLRLGVRPCSPALERDLLLLFCAPEETVEANVHAGNASKTYGAIGSTWCVVSKPWLAQWCRYVGFGFAPNGRVVPPNEWGSIRCAMDDENTSKTLTPAKRKHPIEGGEEHSSVDDFDSWVSNAREGGSATRHKQLSPNIPDTTSAVAHGRTQPAAHMRPGPIPNWQLQAQHNSKRLRRELRCRAGYELVPLRAWRALREWYGGGPEIQRRVIFAVPPAPPQHVVPPTQRAVGYNPAYPDRAQPQPPPPPPPPPTVDTEESAVTPSTDPKEQRRPKAYIDLQPLTLSVHIIGGSGRGSTQATMPTPRALSPPLEVIVSAQLGVHELLCAIAEARPDTFSIGNATAPKQFSRPNDSRFQLNSARIWVYSPMKRGNAKRETVVQDNALQNRELLRHPLSESEPLSQQESDETGAMNVQTPLSEHTAQISDGHHAVLLEFVSGDDNAWALSDPEDTDESGENSNNEGDSESYIDETDASDGVLESAATDLPANSGGAAGNMILEADASGPPPLRSASPARRKRHRQGLVGLRNLGNTCFMASAMQCLCHTPLLTQYFLDGHWKADVNRTSALGAGGHMAQAFAQLLLDIWHTRQPDVAPRAFKSALARYAPQFAGSEQHDAQEFVLSMLNLLSEDLNRIKKKPYVEQPDSNGRPDHELADEWWRNHLRREISVIVALFTGQFKQELRCCTCGFESVRFEAFQYLQLPLPQPSARTVEVIFVFADAARNAPLRCSVRVPMKADVGTVVVSVVAMLRGEREDDVERGTVDDWKCEDAATDNPDDVAPRAYHAIAPDLRAQDVIAVSVSRHVIVGQQPPARSVTTALRSNAGMGPNLLLYELDPVESLLPEEFHESIRSSDTDSVDSDKQTADERGHEQGQQDQFEEQEEHDVPGEQDKLDDRDKQSGEEMQDGHDMQDEPEGHDGQVEQVVREVVKDSDADLMHQTHDEQEIETVEDVNEANNQGECEAQEVDQGQEHANDSKVATQQPECPIPPPSYTQKQAPPRTQLVCIAQRRVTALAPPPLQQHQPNERAKGSPIPVGQGSPIALGTPYFGNRFCVELFGDPILLRLPLPFVLDGDDAEGQPLENKGATGRQVYEAVWKRVCHHLRRAGHGGKPPAMPGVQDAAATSSTDKPECRDSQLSNDMGRVPLKRLGSHGSVDAWTTIPIANRSTRDLSTIALGYPGYPSHDAIMSKVGEQNRPCPVASVETPLPTNAEPLLPPHPGWGFAIRRVNRNGDCIGCGVCACTDTPLGSSETENRDASASTIVGADAATQAIRSEAMLRGCHWLAQCYGCLICDDNRPAFDPPLAEGEMLTVDWRTDVLEEIYDGNASRPVAHPSLRANMQREKQAVSLDACLRAYTRAEKLPDTYCSRCKELRECKMRHKIWRLPPLLIVHLKRFYHAQEGEHFRQHKLSSLVRFPLSGLDLSAYTARATRPGMPRSPAMQPSSTAGTDVAASLEADTGRLSITEEDSPDVGDGVVDAENEEMHDASNSAKHKEVEEDEDDDDTEPEDSTRDDDDQANMSEDDMDEETDSGDQSENPDDSVDVAQVVPEGGVLDEGEGRKHKGYNLYGVVNHFGALGAGHYVASAKSEHDGRWHCFNDHHCRLLDESEVMTSHAYMLFYVREDMVGVNIADVFPPNPRGADADVREEDIEHMMAQRDAGRCVLM